MTSLLEKCMAELGLGETDLLGDFDAVKAVGVRYFEKLLAGEGSRQFLQDVLESRDMTDEILAFNLDWALSHVDRDAAGRTPGAHLRHTIVLHMGGFYELLYWSLRHREPMDVEGELGLVVDSFAEAIAQG